MRKALVQTLVVSGLVCSNGGLSVAQDTMPPPTTPVVPTPSTPTPAAPNPATSVAPPASSAKVELQLRGTVSDVWEAEIRSKDKENKVVLVETDQGQVVLADLGPSDSVKVEEGTPATVSGQMLPVEGAQRFVPDTVTVGAKATGAAPGNAQVQPAMGPSKRVQKQRVSGKVVDKEKMNAKQTHIDHELAVVEVMPGTRVLVDLGPASQLKGLKFDEGDKLSIEGQQIQVNDTAVLVADNVQKGDKKVHIQRQALPKGKAGAKTEGLNPVPTTAPVE